MNESFFETYVIQLAWGNGIACKFMERAADQVHKLAKERDHIPQNGPIKLVQYSINYNGPFNTLLIN